ncbi:MAG TPA: hypothetical protein VHJ34_14920 [Actinomycetota bacterium]|nr:hypothetical protein [Actinomycetota bacterium]
MMRIAVAVVAAALTAALAAPAAAKEIDKVRFCGENGCTTVRDRDALQAFFLGGKPTPPPKDRDFLKATIYVAGPESDANHWTVEYSPGANATRSFDESGEPAWWRVPDDFALGKKLATLGTFPASELSSRPPGAVKYGSAPETSVSAKQPSTSAGSSDPARSAQPSRAPWAALGAAVALVCGAALVLGRRLRAASP